MNQGSRYFVPALLIILLPATALGQFSLTGEITAERVDDPLGSWAYTLHVTWDTGTRYGLSHLDLIFDDGRNCDCEEIFASVRWGDPAGTMTAEGGGMLLDVDHELNCKGDPSIDVVVPLFKFSPREHDGHEAGPTGEMTVVFYSNYAPAAIAEPNLFLVDKFSQYSDFGQVTGVFPALACDPLPIEADTWDSLKARYR